MYRFDNVTQIEAYGTDKIKSQPVNKVTAMFLESPMPFEDGHSDFVSTVVDIFQNADDELKDTIHSAINQAIDVWTQEQSALRNIEALAALSSFTEDRAAIPGLIRIVNEHRIPGLDEASRLAEAKVVASIWGHIPDPTAVSAFETWWKEKNRDWMQTRAIFLGLLEADPTRLEELFSKFISEATQYEDLGDVPLLVDTMTEYVHPDELRRVFRQHLLTHPLDRIIDPAFAELEKLNTF